MKSTYKSEIKYLMIQNPLVISRASCEKWSKNSETEVGVAWRSICLLLVLIGRSKGLQGWIEPLLYFASYIRLLVTAHRIHQLPEHGHWLQAYNWWLAFSSNWPINGSTSLHELMSTRPSTLIGTARSVGLNMSKFTETLQVH